MPSFIHKEIRFGDDIAPLVVTKDLASKDEKDFDDSLGDYADFLDSPVTPSRQPTLLDYSPTLDKTDRKTSVTGEVKEGTKRKRTKAAEKKKKKKKKKGKKSEEDFESSSDDDEGAEKEDKKKRGSKKNPAAPTSTITPSRLGRASKTKALKDITNIFESQDHTC